MTFIFLVFLEVRAEQIKNDFKSINIAFLDSLKGPAQDAKTMGNWSRSSGVDTLNLSDDDIKGGKKLFLAKISQFLEGTQTVNLNYSGHGSRSEKKPGVYGQYLNAAGENCDPKTSVGNCDRKEASPPEFDYFFVSGPLESCSEKTCRPHRDEISRELKCIKIARKDLDLAETACYKPYFECLARQGSKVSESEAIKACIRFDTNCKQNQKIIVMEGIAEAKVKDCKRSVLEKWSKCQQECFDRFAITSEDLNEVLKNKNVFGVFDACHSEGIAKKLNSKSKLILSSALESQITHDEDNGGLMMNALEVFYKTKFCDKSASAGGFFASNLFEQMKFATYKFDKIPLPGNRRAFEVSTSSVLSTSGDFFDNFSVYQKRECLLDAEVNIKPKGGKDGYVN